MNAESPAAATDTAERLTIPLLLARHAAERGAQRFLVTDDDALTYGELVGRTRAVAAKLIERGISRGSRVGLLAANSIDWAVVALALGRIGGVIVPLSTLLTPPELEANLRAAGVERLVISPRTKSRDHEADLAKVRHNLPRLQSVALLSDVAGPAGSGGAPLASSELAASVAPAAADLVDEFGSLVCPADDLAIIFTSGSRGAPKAVIHTHGGALGATLASLGPRGIGPHQRMYIPMPFFWMGGFGGGLLTVFVAGATLVNEADPSPERTLRLLEREKVTLFRGWPDQAAALAAHPARATVDLSHIGPGSLDPLLPPELQAGPGERPVLFGMTETFGPYCCDPLDGLLPVDKRGALGRPFDGVEVQVIDPDTGEALPAGVVGEICVRGPNIMRGFCGRTREQTFTADRWYRTGDSGRLDADGYLWFSGRLDDMFKVAGASVYPSEVDSALESLGSVSRAFSVDLELAGVRRVGAAVILAPGTSATPDSLTAEAKQVLSAFKVPETWRIADPDDIPRTGTGKVDKDALRRFVEGGVVEGAVADGADVEGAV